jgi:DUF4097 and DUF4098 domain-containing protein YvlB
MTTYDFETAGPLELFVELGKGRLTVDTTENHHAHVEISGRDAERVRVEQRGDRLTVVDPSARSAFNFTHPGFDVQIVVPAASGLALKTATADVTATGSYGTAVVNTASAAVRIDEVGGTAVINSGSGPVTLAAVRRAVRVKSGSGDITVGTAGDTLVASTGSGDVTVQHAHGTVHVKTGSGTLRVERADGDISLATASGDLEIGRVERGRVVGKAASGDVRIGVPAGTPVWTDIATGSGRIRSGLHSVGQPQDGQAHVELRARTGSGNVTLVEV